MAGTLEYLTSTSHTNSNTPVITTLIFDMDGVLVDSWGAWFALLNHTLSFYGCPSLVEEEFNRIWGQGMEADRDMFFPEMEINRLKDFYNKHFPEFVEKVTLFPGTRHTLACLRSRGILLALASNSPSGILTTITENFQIRRYFEVMISSEEVPHPKPKPDILLETMKRLAVEPDRVLFIGDSPFDREAAVSAGIRFAGLGIDGDCTLPDLSALLTLEGISKVE